MLKTKEINTQTSSPPNYLTTFYCYLCSKGYLRLLCGGKVYIMVCFCSFLPSYSMTTIDYGGKFTPRKLADATHQGFSPHGWLKISFHWK